VLVVEPGGDRVMGVVALDHEVSDRKLQLVGPQPPRFAPRRKSMTHSEEQQDVRGLADNELAGLEKRRRKRRMLDPVAVEESHHRWHAAAPARLARQIDIVRAGLFQRQAHEFTATLDRRPIIELVAHENLQAASSGIPMSGMSSSL